MIKILMKKSVLPKILGYCYN